MNWLFRFLTWIWSWLQPRRKCDAFGPTVKLDSSTNPERELAAGKLVLIGPPEKAKWLRFKCPCGCGDVIALNLMTSHRPHWVGEGYPVRRLL